MTRLTIGKLAQAVGVSTDTIRFYERCGLLPSPDRTESNYRLYPEASVLRLKFIKRPRILALLSMKSRSCWPCAMIPGRPRKKSSCWPRERSRISKARITDLQRILAALKHLAGACDGHGPADNCPILAAMDTDSDGECKITGHHKRCRHTGT